MAKKKTSAASMVLDMTNVTDGAVFNKRRQPEGDYKGKIIGVQNAKKKAEPSKKMWLWTISVGSGTYPYYTGFGEKELWKIRNLFTAAGVAIPRKRTKLDPNAIVNKYIGVALGDDEYDGKKQSVIDNTFPVSELEDAVEEADEDDEEEEDQEEDAPKSSKKSKAKETTKAKATKDSKKNKKSKKKSTDVDDDELEELDVAEI